VNGIDDWQKDHHKIDVIDSIYPVEIPSYINDGYIVLDVRKIEELKLGLVKQSINIPLHHLEDNFTLINKLDNCLIYCAGGYRSMIASSILKSKGFANVKNIYGGFNAISQKIDSLII
jgi:rhodanese-related sulfurtransferase